MGILNWFLGEEGLKVPALVVNIGKSPPDSFFSNWKNPNDKYFHIQANVLTDDVDKINWEKY